MKIKPIKNPLAYIARLKKQNERLNKRLEIWQEMHSEQNSQIQKLKNDLYYAGECIKITGKTVEVLNTTIKIQKESSEWWANHANKVKEIFRDEGIANHNQAENCLSEMSIEQLEALAFDPNTPEELSNAAIVKLNNLKADNKVVQPGDLASSIRATHLQNRESLIKEMKGKTKNELVKSFLVEMDAKNKSYYFIIENDLMLKFKEYCEKREG